MTEIPNSGVAEDAPQTAAVASAQPTRKGARLPLEFPVVVRVEQENGETLRFNTTTISVSVNGALLSLPHSLLLDQHVLLSNVKTTQEVECIVRSIREKNGISHVGVEFVTWLPEFWEITFPREAGDPPPELSAHTPALLDNDNAENSTEKPPQKPAERPLFGRVGPMPEAPLGEESGSPAQSQTQRNVKSLGLTRRKKYLLMLLPIFVLTGIWLIFRPSTDTETPAPAGPVFVLPADIGPLIPDPSGYRLAAAADFVPQASALLQSLGQPVTGKIPGQFNGKGESLAYIMVKNDKTWRVAIIQHGQVLCDAHYPSIAIAGRVPHELVRRINWIDGLSGQPDGDGLLIVRSAALKDTAVVLFLQGADVISGIPADYEQIPLVQDR